MLARLLTAYADFLPDCHPVSTEIRHRRRTLRYRHLIMRPMMQMKNRVSDLLLETGVSHNKQRLHKVAISVSWRIVRDGPGSTKAVARPIPLDALVTSAVLFWSVVVFPSQLNAGQAFVPPSTVRFAPVMYEDWGPATNATRAATSSTCP